MLQRIGISLDDKLLERFDDLIQKRGWVNRSEVVRDLIRDRLVEEDWTSEDEEAMGVIVAVYDHHAHGLSQKLTEIQHDSFATVISTLHVHMDHHNCLEIMVLKGKPADLKSLADQVIGTKGVKHAKFIPTTSGAKIA